MCCERVIARSHRDGEMSMGIVAFRGVVSEKGAHQVRPPNKQQKEKENVSGKSKDLVSC